MHLYSYHRSSASYRVRIGLSLKGLAAHIVPVNLLEGGQKRDDFLALSPEGRVPVLVEGEQVLTQSLSILEYLDETHPLPPLLPGAPLARARIRSYAQAIACDIAPLNNSGAVNQLKAQWQASEEDCVRWMHHWMARGFSALESLLSRDAERGIFAYGNAPGLFECCLAPQLYNARRFGCPLDDYPILTAIDAACATIPAFMAAHPDTQPDKV